MLKAEQRILPPNERLSGPRWGQGTEGPRPFFSPLSVEPSGRRAQATGHADEGAPVRIGASLPPVLRAKDRSSGSPSVASASAKGKRALIRQIAPGDGAVRSIIRPSKEVGSHCRFPEAEDPLQFRPHQRVGDLAQRRERQPVAYLALDDRRFAAWCSDPPRTSGPEPLPAGTVRE